VTSGNEHITIFLDDIELVVPKGTTLETILRQTNTPYVKGSLIAIGKRERKVTHHPTRFALSTTKGDIIFETAGRKWVETILRGLSGHPLNVYSADANCLTIGSFDVRAKGKYREYELKEGDVFIDLAGMEAKNARLALSKRQHTAFYSMIGGRPIGHVVAGGRILRKLTVKDTIQLHPLASATLRDEYIKTSDLRIKVKDDGTRIYSHAQARLFSETPESAELFFSAVSSGYMRVKRSTGSYVSFTGLRGIKIHERNTIQRRRSLISLRNTGKGQGQIFVYKRPRSCIESHTVIGEINRGMVLFDLADTNDMVSIQVSPTQIRTVGLTQKEAEEKLSASGLKQVRKREIGDEAIVVCQNPPCTLECIKTGFVETFGARPEELVKITLYESGAPESVEYFRVVSGLAFDPVGSLEILYPYFPQVGMVLLRGDSKKATNMKLDPENTPLNVSRKGEIGITNSVKVKTMGMIGVRIDESKEFGPSGEAFDATNIIGRIDEDQLEKIKKKKGMDKVFITEGGR